MKPKYPNSGAHQLWDILTALQKGEAMTALGALKRFGVYAMSQRCTALRKLGWPIQSKLVKVGKNKRVARYWLGKA